MKIRCILFTAFLALFSATAFAAPDKTFESVESCHALRLEIEHAVDSASALNNLLTSGDISEDQFLAELYEGVKILSASGKLFFDASDRNESTCQNVLNEKKAIGEFANVYNLYLKPVQQAYQFFKRAREAAVRLNRQSDVDAFNSAMTEYDAAVMKLAASCKSVLGNDPAAAECDGLSARLGEALK